MHEGAELPRFKTADGKERYMAAYDAALRVWPVPYEELSVPTRFGVTHIVASGPRRAPTLLLLHSLAATATVWRPNMSALSRHYRTLAVDIIGQSGKSPAQKRLKSRGDYAAWIDDVLDALGIERTTLVGCSFGAFLALSQASLAPRRVERVVLIGPAGLFVRLSWRFRIVMRTLPLLRRMRRLFGNRRPPGIEDFRPKGVPLHAEDAPWRALMTSTMAETAGLNTIPVPVLRKSEFRKLRAPVLLLIGEKEALYEPHATLKRAAARVPGLKGAVVTGADHIAAMAQPEDVNRRILDFLAGTERLASPTSPAVTR